MAEEVKTTPPDDSMDSPEKGEMKGEVEGKLAPSGETEVGEVMEEKGEGREGSGEGEAEEKAADQDASGEKEVATEMGGEAGKSVEEETAVESREAEVESEVTEKEDWGKAAEEEIEESAAQEKEAAVAEEKREGAGLVSSEELSGKAEEGVTDEEWITWKKELLNKFHRRFDKKWVISGTAAFMLIAGLVGFLVVPNLRFADAGEVKSLEEIAGPVYDMKFFLPLAVGSGKTRFVKVTVVIELTDKGFKKEIDRKVSELRKEVIGLVLTKSPKEVKSAHGKEVLRKEITTRLNKCLIKE